MRLISLGFLWSAATVGMALERAISPAEAPGKPPLIRSDYKQLPKNKDIIRYLRQWAAVSKNAAYIQPGDSAGGRPIGGLLISSDLKFLNTARKEKARQGPSRDRAPQQRLRVLIVSGQHGNETAGPEAVQRMIYEMLEGSLRHYPGAMDFIVVPNASPDGRDLLSRMNANDVNINTDYIQLSQPESRALRQVLTTWRPHTVLDVHESKAYKEESLAQQGYVTVFKIQYEIGSYPNIDRRLRQFGVDEFLPGLIEKTKTRNLHAARYINEIHDINLPLTHGGITLRNFRNYAGFHNSFSVLVEGRIDPPEGDYPTPYNIKQRTKDLYLSIEAYLEQLQETGARIKTLTALADSDWKGLTRDDQLALRAEYRVDPVQPQIQIPLLEIGTGNLIDMEFKYHGRVVMIDSLQPPLAYVVNKHQDRIAELLQRHGIAGQRVKQALRLEGVKRTINGLKTVPPLHRKGRYQVTLEVQSEPGQIKVHPNALWIDLNQPDGKLVPLLLEPGSSTSIYEEQNYINLLQEGRFFVSPVKSRPAGAPEFASKSP